MPKLEPVETNGIQTGYAYRCLCPMEMHEVTVRPHRQPNGASWEFNGNLEAPTFSPSVLSRIDRSNRSEPKPPMICHHFIRDGMIQFLADCTHAYAGQTVPMLDWVESD